MPVLAGRCGEMTAACALVDRARNGFGGALVIRAAPGLGKTALLELVAADVERTGDVVVLRAIGVQSESHLAYAGLAGVLRPVLAEIHRLPALQQAALRSALALGPPTAHGQLAVAAATLGLLSAAAETGPLLVIVDDLQWVDAGSRLALLYACRRLGADPVAILMAARDGDLDDRELHGVGQLRLAALGGGDGVRSGDGLTSREREVVALAITGATTQDMASTLFVSPKTIEAQLTSIYRKCGVRSKAQLAYTYGGTNSRVSA